MMSQVSSAGRVPTEMEKQSMQWEGAQAPPEGARGYQQQSRDQSWILRGSLGGSQKNDHGITRRRNPSQCQDDRNLEV